MSIYYNVKEHFIVSDTTEQDYSVGVYSHRLVRIGALVLEDNASFNKLVVIADGKRSEFSGDTITKKFHSIIRKISNADSLEIIADYNYFKYGMSAIAPDVLDMVTHLDECIKEFGTDCLDGLFYSIYHKADCSESAGIVLAYGEKNGKLYTGEVEKKAADTLPDGVWYSPQTAVIFDPVEDGLKNIEEIEPICREMTKFSSYDELTVNEDGISFYLNNLELKNNDELIEFTDLCRKLLKATNGEAFAQELGLTDLISDDGRIATVKIDINGGHELQLESVE
ncbi:MAG: hypothetical protein IJE14_02705 [Clostridia bacterium]|nr:hypothetical protein [Clostridia bacterium]